MAITAAAKHHGAHEIETPFGFVQVTPVGEGIIYVTSDDGEPPYIEVNNVRVRLASLHLKLENGRYTHEWGNSHQDLTARYTIERRDGKAISDSATKKVLSVVPDLVTKWAFHNAAIIRTASFKKLVEQADSMTRDALELEGKAQDLRSRAAIAQNQAKLLANGQDPAALYDRPRILVFSPTERVSIIRFDPATTNQSRFEEIRGILGANKAGSGVARIARKNGTIYFYDASRRTKNRTHKDDERIFDDGTTGSAEGKSFTLPGVVVLARIDGSGNFIGLTDRDIIKEMSSHQER